MNARAARTVLLICVVLVVRSATAAAAADDTEDELKCLDHFLDMFIRKHAPEKIEQLLTEYSEKAAKFGPEIRKHFRAAHDAVEHSFEHIKDRVPDAMQRVKDLARNEQFNYLMPSKFTAEVMQIFSDDELQETCLELTKKKEVEENEEALRLLSMIADRVETIGQDGAQLITKKCLLAAQ